MKKKLSYVLAVTKDYMFSAGNVVLSSIKQMPKKNYDFVIFYDEILPNDRKIFEATEICKLVNYKIDENFKKNIIRFCPKFNDLLFSKYFNFIKFAKFEIFKLLDKYENIVWLDSDIAIQSDISTITNFRPFGITADESWTVQNNFTAPIKNYDMNRDGVCSAVILINDMLPYEKMYDFCYKMAVECSPYYKNVDQGIINILLQEFNITPNLMPLKDWQCISWRKEAISAKIVHFGTNKKVWTNTNVCNSFPEWYRIHSYWLSLGGSDFDRSEIEPRNILSLLEHFDALKKQRKYKLFGIFPLNLSK
ncbi:MAG: glycosyltransferase [Endomicrobium sp.]|jgi:lipopolysaccharide biosynthesis glycosyltransferase|nr:glycosyltransferase [Endomicrobium sp.]